MTTEENLSETGKEAEESTRAGAEQAAAEAGDAGVTIESLQTKLSELNEALEAHKDQAVRAQAEAQNIRRRAENDIEKAHKFALERFVKELLPIVDSLEKAVEASSGDDEALASVRQGVELTLGMFHSVLEKFNVTVLEPVGEPFDPQHHEAMSMVENPDLEPNSVMAVVQKGYLLNGRLVRPAMVIVAKGGAGQTLNEQA